MFFLVFDILNSDYRFDLLFVDFILTMCTDQFHIHSFLSIFRFLSQLSLSVYFPTLKDNLPIPYPAFQVYRFHYQDFFLHSQDSLALSIIDHQFMNLIPLVRFRFIPILFYKFLFLAPVSLPSASNFLIFHQSNLCILGAAT